MIATASGLALGSASGQGTTTGIRGVRRLLGRQVSVPELSDPNYELPPIPFPTAIRSWVQG